MPVPKRIVVLILLIVGISVLYHMNGSKVVYKTEISSNILEVVLVSCITFFLLVTLILFIIIMVYRRIRLFDMHYQKALKEVYGEVFILAAFAPDKDELEREINKARALNNTWFTKKKYARLITAELLSLQNSLSGEFRDNLVKLYNDAGFRDYSRNKIKSSHWEIVAQGVREIAAMKDESIIPVLMKLNRSGNKLIRENAQISLVKINGFKGLDFLNDINAPISDWQQINILEALKEYKNNPLPDFSVWLNSREKTVVLFVIRLIRHFRQMETISQLLSLINSEDALIKIEVIRTLSDFNQSHLLEKLCEIYESETVPVKLEIIKACGILGHAETALVLSEWMIKTEDMEIQKTCLESIIALQSVRTLEEIISIKPVLKEKVSLLMNTRYGSN